MYLSSEFSDDVTLYKIERHCLQRYAVLLCITKGSLYVHRHMYLFKCKSGFGCLPFTCWSQSRMSRDVIQHSLATLLVREMRNVVNTRALTHVCMHVCTYVPGFLAGNSERLVSFGLVVISAGIPFVMQVHTICKYCMQHIHVCTYDDERGFTLQYT